MSTMLTMMLPIEPTAPEPIAAEAVVVRHRSIDSATNGDRFELALFFTKMNDDAREKLETYLAR